MPTNKQRRDAARRHLERQLERRAQREATRKRFALITSILGTVVVLALVVGLAVWLGGDGGDGTNPAAAADTPAGTTSPSVPPPPPPGECTFTKGGGTSDRKVTIPKDGKVPTKGTVTVRVATNRGKLTFALDRAEAPCTVYSFVALVKQGFYDKTPCHRLVTSGIYVLQCGDPTGTGTGGPGYTIPDEATGSESYPAGTIAMARTQAPDSGGSQFFIVYKNSPNLKQNLGKQQYTVFGTVADGLDVVKQVAAGGTANGGTDGKPKLSTDIESMRVAKPR